MDGIFRYNLFKNAFTALSSHHSSKRGTYPLKISRLKCIRGITCVQRPSSAAKVWKAHIDYKSLQENIEYIRENNIRRNVDVDVEEIGRLYSDWVSVAQRSYELRAARKVNASKMKENLSKDAKDSLISEGKVLKRELLELEEELKQREDYMHNLAITLPNATHPNSPIGEESNARIRYEYGSPVNAPYTDFKYLDHLEICDKLDLLDLKNATKVSGAKFYFLKNDAVRLELALVQYCISKIEKHGFTLYTTPELVRTRVVEGCGFQPRASNSQVYNIEQENDNGVDRLCLTGTAEIPLSGIHMDEILEENVLPLKMCGLSHCFRTEAGAAGSNSRGLYRVHQFTKVEMVVLATPNQSEHILNELVDIEREICEDLGLCFKIIDMPSCDLGAPAYRKFDLEAWLPGLARYGELCSASNCTDYQSRRLNIRYREGSGENLKVLGKKNVHFVHTLNATGIAIPRMMVAILETFQQRDGSVIIPSVLQNFMGGQSAIRPP